MKIRPFFEELGLVLLQAIGLAPMQRMQPVRVKARYNATSYPELDSEALD